LQYKNKHEVFKKKERERKIGFEKTLVWFRSCRLRVLLDLSWYLTKPYLREWVVHFSNNFYVVCSAPHVVGLC
jgi:hypothetical protein